jgi:xylulose-5-phosphate/fructose-6-phosphate phosphoketolase
MLNNLDRFHLVTDVIDRVPGLAQRAAALRQRMSDERLRHRTYTRQVGDDAPDVRDWVWPGSPPLAEATTDTQRGQPA